MPAAAYHCPINPSIACVVSGQVAQAPQDPYSIDPAYTLKMARLVLQQVESLGLPCDPATFTILYAYVTKANPALNRAINETIADKGTLPLGDLESLYQRYFWQARWEAGVHRAGAALADELGQIVSMLDAVIGGAAETQDDLSNASEKLTDANLDRSAVRAIVESVIAITRKVEEENGGLALRLKQSRDQVSELQTNLDALQAESMVDPLTGIGNRKRFDMEIARRLDDARHHPVSLLMIDVDHFKRFNDTYGHQLGDDVLRLVAQTIKNAVRADDVATRYGGEEMAVLLSKTPLSVATLVGEKIRVMIGDRNLVKRNTGEKVGHVTVSVGVAQAKPGDTIDALIRRADRRLYEAKTTGRNRVVGKQSMGARPRSEP